MSQINEEKMKNHVKFMAEEVIPKIKGENGEGLHKLQQIAALRRKELEDSKKK